MQKTSLPFYIPKPQSLGAQPEWDGKRFVVGNYSSPVLEYSENFDGWTDDLSKLHSEEAGSNHPIDVASRQNAIEQISDHKHFIGNEYFSLIEIGCSSGYMLEALIKSFPNAYITGGDVVSEPLYSLARRHPGVPLFRFDLLKSPFSAGSFNIIVILNVLEHIENDCLALKKLHNMLTDNGILILEVPAGKWLYDEYDFALSHFRRYSYKELLNKIEAAGFVIVRKSTIGFLLYPAFVIHKLLGKLRMRDTDVLRNNIRKTKSSVLLKYLCEFESKHLNRYSLPFGIRFTITCKKRLEG